MLVINLETFPINIIYPPLNASIHVTSNILGIMDSFESVPQKNAQICQFSYIIAGETHWAPKNPVIQAEETAFGTNCIPTLHCFDNFIFMLLNS